MNRPFSPNPVRPNLPLRKPSSSPVALSAASPPSRLTTMPSSSANGDSPILSSYNREKLPILGSTPPALTVYFCNYCGQQGNFRCKRCKKAPYCSVVCQTEDWKAHRHMCKGVDPEPVKEKPKNNTTPSVTLDTVSSFKHGDNSSLQRVYLKDLHMTKMIKGTDIQATVVEFYSPGRFFLLPKSPELLEALLSISTELQKTYSRPTMTTYVPFVGEVCTVQFSCDMNWYRGLVKTLAADQKMANILYIDFGNEEDVPLERIMPLPANIQPFCPCAMECRIAGVVPVGGNWSGECCIAVRQMLSCKTVSVRLVKTLENRIHAVDILLSIGKQLSTFLIENSYAEKITPDVTPTEQDINAMVSASLENFRRLSSGKDDNTWAQPPEPLTQSVGDSLSVVVTHLQSPSEIIVQKVENAGVIQELQVKLREHCFQVPSPQNFRPAPGTVCCAQFSEDKQWYRAKVLAYSSEKQVCVGYIDFGNSEEVDLGHLRPISTSLLVLPVQALRCGLAVLHPLEHLSLGSFSGVRPIRESWSEDCLLALQRRVSNRILRIDIQGAHEGKALVAMIDEASDPQANVAELLIFAGYGAPDSVTISSDQQADKTAADPHGVETSSSMPTPTCEPLVWSCTDLSCDGQTVALLVSVVENPGEFYCRIDNPADHQRLIELGTELKQHSEADAAPFEPKVGEPCCAMFPGDNEWRRAMVKALSEDWVCVNFVDYGFTMKVEKSHLRSITPRLLTLPFQAIRCFLTGVEPLGSEWSSEALLWFQTLVDGEQLSARVLSVTTQGYGVELTCRGQNVAAALLSEHLAKVPGQIPKETEGSTEKSQAGSNNNEPNQILEQTSNQTGACSKEMSTERLSAAASEVPSFPVDWKTVELPLNETFQPYFAAVSSPSLFYVLGPSQVDQQKLQEEMIDVTAYCNNNQASLSSTILSRPAPGAACCAQFSADNKWYRAVVLETGESEMSVIYADYGNTEKVPLSRILPIPSHLLQLPFQITRCTLAGKDHFPAEWPDEVQQLFHTILLNGVLATVDSFDGSANVLSLTVPTERGGGHLTAMVLDALQAQTKTHSCADTTQRYDQTDSCTPSTSPTAVADCPQPTSMPEIQQRQENKTANTGLTMIPEPAPQPLEQDKKTCAVSVDDPQTSSCCCQSLKTEIQHLEQLMQLQLSLIKQLVGQTK
ncbi:tudor domain-containing protein 1 isoform X2 [Anabas testudineus]|nr:tudor domain-containing protein 1 isoform X2 [Anabas testudineus]XP_026206589.1 tudor domain-containing protein 1 isoform X2 [Anabas testudineus]